MSQRLAIIVLLIATISPLSADTHYVIVSNAVPEQPYTNWATAATVIQDAVDAAEDGDTVLVDEGAYNLLAEISITNGIVVSGFGAASNVVVNGSGSNRCFYISHSNAVVTGLTIASGVARIGGGVLIDGSGRVARCVIQGNAATGLSYSTGGGGVCCTYGGSVEHCLIMGNRAAERGAGVYCWHGGTVRNCLIVENAATNKAGGIACLFGGVIENCTVASNLAGSKGGGLHASGKGTCTIENTIIWSNSSGDARFPNIEGDLLLGMEFLHCCTPDLGEVRGTGNFADDPGFRSVSEHDFHVSVVSPCIDAGTNREWMASEKDLDGRTRVKGPSVDVGAYEVPHTRLACALSATPAAGFVPVRMELLAKVRGETTPDLFFSWDIQGDGVYDRATTNQDVIAVTYDNPGIFTVGVAVSNAAGATSEAVGTNLISAFERIAYVAPDGGGIPPYGTWATAAPNIGPVLALGESNIVILVTDGVYSASSPLQVDTPIVLRSVNGAARTVIDGGRTNRCLEVSADGAIVEGFTIQNGIAEFDGAGGGVLLSGAGVLRNCVVRWCTSERDNLRYEWGGGVHVSDGATVQNCFIYENHSDEQAGGVYCGRGGRVISCTICNNTLGTIHGRGVNALLVRDSIIVNCIITDGDDSRPDWADDRGAPDLTHCCTAPLPSGIGNITNAPLLDGQFRLSSNSPCIDAGVAMPGITTDAFGTPRPLDGDGDGAAGWDMGAHEFVHLTADSDRDGIGDSDEMNQHGTSPVVADSDGDGSSDGHELVAGTDPLDATSTFVIHDEQTDAVSGDSVLSWPSVTGRLYNVVCCTNLLGGNWFPVPGCTNLLGNGGVLACTNAVTDPALFYRVVVMSP